MSLPIPTPAALAQRFAAALAQQTFIDVDGNPVRLDATAPATLEQALSVLFALNDYETYLYVRDICVELMLTTATENGLLPKHASIWGVPRLGATMAVGNVIMQSSVNIDLTIPAGAVLTVDGSAQWAVIAATTIAANAAASVPVRAVTAGITGNLAANTTMQFVSPVPGVQTVTSDQNGVAGGASIEPAEQWRARIIDEIRYPEGAGTVRDYIKWAKSGGATYVNVVPLLQGAGTVGIFVAMTGGVTPTPAELSVIEDAIDLKKPVTAKIYLQGATLAPQDLAITLRPDTVAARSAVTTALTSYFLAIGIGGTIYREGIDAAVFSSNGAANDLTSPTTNIALEAFQMPVLGKITWGVS